ncbi:MAG: hypothetical protein OEX76_05675 [Candidatus Bathyarchaeota archaeon]|jgi:hypothetical protein|nr:hypothetical protein [Candidatus Bathyarchaeota archaeon]MDH5531988.1 hypothetical protein [Candidatus Bathyarchaeota archaeon]MDH5713598.1 hypothetical protein [Candidatus Bathyarchaeota archaeon]
MGLLDWFRRRRKKRIDKEKEVLERTGKLQTEIEERMEEEPKKRKGKKESV